MKRYKPYKFEEMIIYTKPFWHSLIHSVKNPEDKQSILQNGFLVGQNDFILKGIYTVPDVWYGGNIRARQETIIQIYTKKNTRVYDSGADRPIDSLRGIGSLKFNLLYCKILKKLKYNLLPASIDEDYNWYKKNAEVIEKFLDDSSARKLYQKLLFNELIKKYDVYINGGELIIINPECIEEMV